MSSSVDGAVGALVGMVPVAVAGGLAMTFMDRIGERQQRRLDEGPVEPVRPQRRAVRQSRQKWTAPRYIPPFGNFRNVGF